MQHLGQNKILTGDIPNPLDPTPSRAHSVAAGVLPFGNNADHCQPANGQNMTAPLTLQAHNVSWKGLVLVL